MPNFDSDELWFSEQRRLNASDTTVEEARSKHHLVVDDSEHYVVPVVRCVDCRLTLETPDHPAARRHVAYALAAVTAPQEPRRATNTGRVGGWDGRESQTRWEPSSKEAS